MIEIIQKRFLIRIDEDNAAVSLKLSTNTQKRTPG